MDLFLGIDLGTSYFKAALFNKYGRLQGLGRMAVPKQSHAAGVCELPIESFWSTLKQAIATALEQAEARPEQIIALSYASQANSFVLLDAQHRPLTPIILWPDERAGDTHPDLQAFCGLSAWRIKTGMGIPLSKYSAVNKLLWFQSFPDVFRKTHLLLTISDYLTYSLTGNLYSDMSTASLLGLLEVQNGDWWPEAIACILPGHANMAALQRTGTSAGKLTIEGAALVGLSANISFFMGGLDHHIAAIGAGIRTGNYLSESTGTVLAAVDYSDHYLPTSTVCVAPATDSQHYFNMTFHNNGAGMLEWYHNNYAPAFSIQQLLQQAALIRPGCEGLRVAQDESPDESAYGFEGRLSHHGHGHFVRAILEAAAWRLSSLIEKLDPDASKSVVSTGGGARSTTWTSIKAAITGRTFIIPECSEAACLGGALVAAAGIGLFSNYESASPGWIKYQSTFEPQTAERDQYLKQVSP